MIWLARAKTVSNSNSSNRVRQELVQEQRRLAKLWDAFKKQEDEYRGVERERDDLWTRVQELEKASSRIGDPVETLTRLQHLEQENERLRKDLGHVGAMLEENRKTFHAEQERLAKLYKVYEDSEAQLVQATKELEKWHKWWDRYGKDLPPKIAKAASSISSRS